MSQGVTWVQTAKARARAPGLAALACLLLAACGPSASISLQLDPSSLVMALGATETVEVTLARSGAASAGVSLSASGAPDWVTVSFDPETLSGSANTSTMTVATDAGHPDAGPSSFTLTVTATGPGLNASAQLQVEVESMDVAGVVTDPFGEPLADYTVFVPGHTPQLTGADGAFSFTGVAAPYDLTLVSSGGGGSTIAHTFLGLTTPTPSPQPISSALGLGGTEFSATVSGGLQHATLVPIPAEHGARVCVEGIDVQVVFGCSTLTAAASSFTTFPSWSQDSSTPVRLRAVVYQLGADGEPNAIVATGTSPTFTLADTDTPTQDVTLTETASQAAVSSTVTVPAGYTLSGRQLVAHHSAVASFGFDEVPGPSLTRSVIAPFFAGVDYSLFVRANSNAPMSVSVSVAWAAGLAPGDAVTLELPRPAVQVTPPDASTGISNATEFTVINPEGGVVTYVIAPTGAGPAFVVTTQETTARIPDLTTIGLPLPGSVDYTWQALVSHDVTTVDAAASGDGYLGQFAMLSNASNGGGPGPTEGGRVSTSDARTFTTQ